MAYPGYEPARSAPQDLDVFSELRRISVELRALSQAANAAVRPAARFEGYDSSGTVTIAIDGRQHVQQVRLDPRWAQRLPRDGVGEALMQAYGEAVGELLTASSEAFDEADQEADRARLEQQVDAELGSYRRRYVAPEDLLDEVHEQLRQVEMLQRYGDTPSVPARGRGDVTVSGPAGFVEITVRGGQIGGIRVLLSRLPAMATNGTIAQEAMAAFRAAALAAPSGT